MVARIENTPRYAEFFCGGGMVRAALGARWNCVLANDIDPMKCAVYAENWGRDGLVEADIADLNPALLRQPIDLYWASSPCQDFSLAGKGLGLRGARSGVFHSWIEKIQLATKSGFRPAIIAFENVTGLVARNGGKDFAHVLKSLIGLGYRVGALEIDARAFLPQSRPRIFVIAARLDIKWRGLCNRSASGVFHSTRLQRFVENADADIRRNWVWWSHTDPDPVNYSLAHVVENRGDMRWFSDAEVSHLLNMMSPPSLRRLEQARSSGELEFGTIYRRGRPGPDGMVRQRAELRFDGIAGCLRTPAGGSSRQTLIVVKGNETKARLISITEVKRLMGLKDEFVMPDNYNMSYKVAGDGVAVPIVEYIDRTVFQPLLNLNYCNADVA